MKNILEILVFGLIGSYINAEGKKIKGLELEDIVAQVKSNPGFEEIHVKINSTGGDAQAGFDIYDYIRSLNKPVTTMVEGDCMSIATVIALSGDKRTITSDSNFMIHNPWASPSGDADEIAAAAKKVQIVEDQIINFYHEHTGIEKKAIDAMMKKETEMTPSIAVDTNFMTEMVNKVEVLAFAPKGKLVIGAKKVNPADTFIKKMEAYMAGKLSIFNQKDVTWTLADGTQIVIKTEDGTPAVGNEVTKGGQPLEDGDHKILDGSSMTIKEGKISMLTPASSGSEHEDEEDKDKNPAVEVLKAENKELKSQMAGITQNQNVANAGMLAMVKSIQVLGENIKSGYKPDSDTPSFNRGSDTLKDTDNCVTAIADREKEYKGYKKPKSE